MARIAACLHCNQVRRLVARSLCKRCYETPTIRSRYPILFPRTEEDLVGRRFTRLIVEKFVGSRGEASHRNRMWLCRCDCDNLIEVSTSNLENGNTQSCGCWKRDLLESHWRTHGQSKTATYRAWCAMKTRCYCPTHRDYRHYGGRGIRVCQAWRDSFEAFLADVGECPSPRHSIDRYPDQNGNYEPGNVRWATKKEQCHNRRNNRLLTFQEQTKTIAEWAESLGVREALIRKRLHLGWSVEEILTLPTLPRGRRKATS